MPNPLSQNEDGDIVIARTVIGCDRWGDEHKIVPGIYEFVNEFFDDRSGENVTVILEPTIGEVGIIDGQ